MLTRMRRVRRNPDLIWTTLVATLWAFPAEGHCRYPKVLIRHLGECVSPRSKLAMAYVQVGHWRFAIRPLPVAVDPPPPKRIYNGPPGLLPSEYPARPVTLTPRRVPVPELEAGAPPIWRICIEHHEWCQSKEAPNDR
jgi:hypothetical protein